MALSSRAALMIRSFLVLLSSVAVLGTRRAGFFNNTKIPDNYRQYTAGVVIFGDSTVDVGNNNHLVTVVKSNFKPYGRSFQGGKSTGRFCDGKITSDRITEIIGYPYGLPYLSPEAHGPAILTGINFASSASGWYDGTARNFNVKGLTDQFVWYKNWKAEVLSLVGPEKGNFIISTSLYIFSTGANDWVNNYYLNPVLMKKYNTDEYITFLIGLARGYIQELYDLGGRNIAVLGLPPLGCLPSQITLHGKGNQGCVEDYNAVSRKFNDQLKNVINNELKPKFSGGRLIYIDIYTTLYAIRTNSSAYGITEVRTGCCGTGVIETAIACNQASIGTCEDANSYLWWDSFHPTEHAYNILADDLFNQAEATLRGPAHP
ncbi:GDSL esterase/lipase At5g22810 [Physcomitrium patens]|uniref:Uncharacterized protein n=1 Tax=Physcomitrium patens TaxID=3218 RepID=A0A2K1IBQ3_PHYPA|nr:hypothetical protein PHYPA_030175 [Physcomitrium patens]